jgi:hypothetical protein
VLEINFAQVPQVFLVVKPVGDGYRYDFTRGDGSGDNEDKGNRDKRNKESQGGKRQGTTRTKETGTRGTKRDREVQGEETGDNEDCRDTLTSEQAWDLHKAKHQRIRASDLFVARLHGGSHKGYPSCKR